MNMRRFWLAGCTFAFSAGLAFAVPRYVSPSGGNVPPYDTWEKAATTIQPAISACAEGDEVIVTNGVYATGGVAVFGAMTNRIAITNAIAVRSVNGPAFTSIVGQGPVGPAAIRCAWIASNAVLAGFTLTNGHTLATGDNQREINGGGAWCEYEGGTISNCVIAGCEAANMGGGFYQGQVIGTVLSNNAATFGGGGSGSSAARVDRCVFVGNRSVRDGGGLYSGQAVRNSHFTGNVAGERGGGLYGVWNVESCTVAGNSAEEVGGAAAASVSNSIVYYNADQFGSPNYSPGWDVAFSCTTPDPGGVGNVTNAPGLAGLRNPHLVTNSPCVDQGTNSAWMAAAIDVDGEPRLVGTVDMGCDEVVATGMVAGVFIAIQCDRTNAVVGVPIRFNVEIQNRPTKFTWNWGDGTGATNETVVEHAYAVPGEYVVTVQAWNRFAFVTNALNVRIHAGFTNYVSKTGGNAPPYLTWATAATNVQDAVDRCAKGGTVLVSNGVYAGGGAERFSSNRVAITNAMTVRSVNGPAQTALRGVASTGLDAMRGAYVGNGAQLIGFSVTGGRSRGSSVPIRLLGETQGGGLYAAAGARIADCLVTNNGALNGGGAFGWGTFTNCVLADNSAANSGGGALFGYFVDCRIGPDNEAKYGAGLAQADAENCLIATNWASENGGGAYISALRRCRIEGNASALSAGGVSYGEAENCLILFNEARNGNGGGALGATLRQCTVRGNDASGSGGGTYAGAVDGSIVYFNYAAANDNAFVGAGSLDYSCTFPAPGSGTGNITNDPQFVAHDGFPPDFHLLATSPCIDAGSPLSTVANDYEGRIRPIDGDNDGTNVVDMGAYEHVYVPPSVEIAPANTNVPARASSGRQIAVAANVPWTAAAQAPWLVLTAGAAGSGNGAATFRVLANGTTAARTGMIAVAGSGIVRTCTVVQAAGPATAVASADFDGDGTADVATFQPANGNWSVQYSGGGSAARVFGSKTMVPVPADYDGDGTTDYALYQRSTGFWFILNSGGGSRKVTFGPNSAMVPLPGDYDGDGKADLALFYPAQARWYFHASTEGYSSVQFGGKTDIPVPADYDGDGAIDLAVYRPANGNWYVIYSGGGSRVTQLGWAGTIPVPADYDGDGKADFAVLSRATSKWCIAYSGGGSLILEFGYKTMTPVPADYDGDGKADVAMYHPASGSWFIRQSSTLTTRKVVHGGPDRIPVLLYPLIYSWFGLP